jgi:CHAT domain-containing protein
MPKTLSFARLPGTKQEAEAIVSLYSKRHAPRVELLEGPAATKDRLRAALPGHRYLHLATHGYFAPPELKSGLVPEDRNTGLPLFEAMGRREASGWYPGLLSGLVCSGAAHPPTNPATGSVDMGACMMTAEEVAALDLSACELAVLSACESGLGRTAGGEGVLGLQRAFHGAGARTVVASLWKVDDQATQQLMKRFYENLWDHGIPPAEALRQAQLHILRFGVDQSQGRGLEPVDAKNAPASGNRTTNPRLWAAWIMSGDPGGLAGANQAEQTPSRAPSRSQP